MERRYPVFVIEENDDWGHHDVNMLPCATMSLKQIKKYLQDLDTAGQIPVGSCIYRMSAAFNYTNSKTVTLSYEQSQNTQNPEKELGSLQIHITRSSAKKCPNRDCFANIQNGRCTDEFMINVIGKKFFARKYTNTKKQK